MYLIYLILCFIFVPYFIFHFLSFLDIFFFLWSVVAEWGLNLSSWVDFFPLYIRFVNNKNLFSKLKLTKGYCKCYSIFLGQVPAHFYKQKYYLSTFFFPWIESNRTIPRHYCSRWHLAAEFLTMVLEWKLCVSFLGQGTP